MYPILWENHIVQKATLVVLCPCAYQQKHVERSTSNAGRITPEQRKTMYLVGTNMDLSLTFETMKDRHITYHLQVLNEQIQFAIVLIPLM